MIPLDEQGHTVPHLKALRYGKDVFIGLSCGNTFNIIQGILNIEDLLHKQGLVETQLLRTVTHQACEGLGTNMYVSHMKTHRILKNEMLNR